MPQAPQYVSVFTFAQFGLHGEVKVFSVVCGVDDTEERGGCLAVEPKGRKQESLISSFVLQASLEQVWQTVW